VEIIDPLTNAKETVSMTYYDLTQRQRAYERTIRTRRREVSAANGVLSGCKKGSEEYELAYRDFQAASLQLRSTRKAYKDFSESVGLLTRNERTQAYGFDRSVSAKAVWAARKAVDTSTPASGNADSGLADIVIPSTHEILQKSLTKNNNSGIIGLRTVNGIQITEISKHSGERLKERYVSLNGVIDALTNPLKVNDVIVDELGRKSQRFIGKDSTVNINPDTGVITTAWVTGKKTRKKYEKGGE
jgi:hypothetical protein